MQLELGFGLTKYAGFIVYFGAFAVMFLTLFRRIEYGIFFLVPFIPLQNVLDYTLAYPGGKDINDLMLFCLLVRWIIDRKKGWIQDPTKRWKKGEKFFVKSPLNLPIGLLILWTLIELFRGASYLGWPMPTSFDDPRVVAWKISLMVIILFFIVLNNIKERKHMQLLILVMALSILSLDRNFYNAAKTQDMTEYSNWRFATKGQALGGNALAVFQGQYAVMLVFMSLAAEEKWKKYLFGFIAAFTFYCVMFSFSRSGYLAAVTMFFLGVVKDRRILIGLVVIALCWQVVLPKAVQQRITMTKSDEGGYDQTVMERMGMWELAKGIVSSRPVAGAGYGVTPFLNIRVNGFTYTWASFHSAYIETAVELGLLGLGLQLLIFILGGISGFRLYLRTNDKFLQALGLSCAGITLGVLAGNLAGTYWTYMGVMGFYWVIQAMVLRSLATIKEEAAAAVNAIQAPALVRLAPRLVPEAAPVSRTNRAAKRHVSGVNGVYAKI